MIKDAWDAGLHGRERIFVLNYCTNGMTMFNGTASFKLAYTKVKNGRQEYVPDDNVANVGACKLLKKERIKTAVRLLLKMTQQEEDLKGARQLLGDLLVQATYNPADIIDSDGRLVVDNLKDLGPLAKCISQITTTKEGYRIVLADRSKAQDKLMRYYNLIREEPTIRAEMPVIYIAPKAETSDQWNKDNHEETAEASADAVTGTVALPGKEEWPDE